MQELQNDGRILKKFDTNVYSIEAINSTCHKFSTQCYLNTQSFSDKVIGIYFKHKDREGNLYKIIDEFCNELTDQQVRYDIEKEFGFIRDEIVRKAFSPIDK
jgi:His-Xaa-Ser system protein HxsD